MLLLNESRKMENMIIALAIKEDTAFIRDMIYNAESIVVEKSGHDSAEWENIFWWYIKNAVEMSAKTNDCFSRVFVDMVYALPKEEKDHIELCVQEFTRNFNPFKPETKE